MTIFFLLDQASVNFLNLFLHPSVHFLVKFEEELSFIRILLLIYLITLDICFLILIILQEMFGYPSLSLAKILLGQLTQNLPYFWSFLLVIFSSLAFTLLLDYKFLLVHAILKVEINLPLHCKMPLQLSLYLLW